MIDARLRPSVHPAAVDHATAERAAASAESVPATAARTESDAAAARRSRAHATRAGDDARSPAPADSGVSAWTDHNLRSVRSGVDVGQLGPAHTTATEATHATSSSHEEAAEAIAPRAAHATQAGTTTGARRAACAVAAGDSLAALAEAIAQGAAGHRSIHARPGDDQSGRDGVGVVIPADAARGIERTSAATRAARSDAHIDAAERAARGDPRARCGASVALAIDRCTDRGSARD